MEVIEETEFPLSTTTRKCDNLVPCQKGRNRFFAFLGKADRVDDEPFPFEVMLNAVGLFMTSYCCPAEPRYDLHWRRFAVWCARQVQHLIRSPECVAALDVAERFCNGEATKLELAEAAAAAWRTAQNVDEATGWLAIRRANEAAAHAASCRTPLGRKPLPCSTPVFSTAIAVVEAFGLHKSTMRNTEADMRSQIEEGARLKKQNERVMLDRLKAAFRMLVTEGHLP